MSLNEYKIGVIGVGFVGSAVCKGFSSDTKRPTEVYKCDPKLGSKSIPISDMARFVDVMFLCLPTPTGKDGYDMEPSFLRNALFTPVGVIAIRFSSNL